MRIHAFFTFLWAIFLILSYFNSLNEVWKFFLFSNRERTCLLYKD